MIEQKLLISLCQKKIRTKFLMIVSVTFVLYRFHEDIYLGVWNLYVT